MTSPEDQHENEKTKSTEEYLKEAIRTYGKPAVIAAYRAVMFPSEYGGSVDSEDEDDPYLEGRGRE